MKTRRVLLAVLLSLTALAPGSASADADSVRVTKVLVNRLGGVSVIGEMSCAGTAAVVRAGDFTYWDEYGGETTIPALGPSDDLVLLTNPDQYTVSQPSGRKAMLQVTHVSSRATPCYTDRTTWTDGTPIACVPGATCPWVTDRFGYDRAMFGPLFDYATGGKFKTGSLDVTGNSGGLFIEVIHDTDPITSDLYVVEDGFFVTYSQIVKAIGVR